MNPLIQIMESCEKTARMCFKITENVSCNVEILFIETELVTSYTTPAVETVAAPDRIADRKTYNMFFPDNRPTVIDENTPHTSEDLKETIKKVTEGYF